ncbi:hypothetical protein HID58_051972 [Brassica napus]|uniref:Uncharacterized protein n=1 Tax=Brassica napus TaxID=3708 RepID=A0ABQ8AAY3_BRANA|nr:hypothetical protein HID58_051972 [Brassica napus]
MERAIEKAIYLLRRGCSSSRWLSRRVLLTKENGIPSIGWSHRRRIMVRSLFFAVALLLLGGWKALVEMNFELDKTILDSLGIDFLTLFNCHPPLHSSPLSSIKPVVDYMTTPPINFSLQDVCHLVSMFPNLLTSYLISHTIPVITLLLREVGFNSIFHLSPALRLRPRLLACSADTQLRHVFYFLLGIGILETIKDKLLPRIEYFQKLGLSCQRGTPLFTRSTQLFNYSVAENYEPKVSYLVGEMRRDMREFGLNRDMRLVWRKRCDVFLGSDDEDESGCVGSMY